MELLNTAFAGGRIITILGGQSNEFTGNCDGRLCMGRHRRLSLEQGALSGKYDAARPFPEGSARAKVFNPLLPQLEALVGELKKVAATHSVSAAQIATAYAVEVKAYCRFWALRSCIRQKKRLKQRRLFFPQRKWLLWKLPLMRPV